MSNLGSKFRLTAMALSTIGLCCPVVSSADPGTLQFSQATFDVYEGDGTVTIEVNRTDGSEGEVSVDYATSGGTATAGADYQEKSGVLEWGDEDTEPKTFEVSIIDDNESNEAYETFNIELSDPTGGASLGEPNEATVEIADNECGPGPHWVDNCPGGPDEAPSKAIIGIALGADCTENDKGIKKVRLTGPTEIWKGDPVDAIIGRSELENRRLSQPPTGNVGSSDGHLGVIETEMVSLELSGEIPGIGPITVRAGDGVGNLSDDGTASWSRYSPGAIAEWPEVESDFWPLYDGGSLPRKPALPAIEVAYSFFNVWFEIDTPMGKLHNKEAFLLEGIITKTPPTPTNPDGTKTVRMGIF